MVNGVLLDYLAARSTDQVHPIPRSTDAVATDATATDATAAAATAAATATSPHIRPREKTDLLYVIY